MSSPSATGDYTVRFVIPVPKRPGDCNNYIIRLSVPSKRSKPNEEEEKVQELSSHIPNTAPNDYPLQPLEREVKPVSSYNRSHIMKIYQKANELGDQGNIKGANEEFERALNIPGGEKNFEVLCGYGWTLFLLGEEKEVAKEWFEKGFELLGKKQYIFTYSNEHFMTLSSLKEGAIVIEAEEHRLAIYRYAKILLELGQFAEAKKWFEKGINLPGGEEDLLLINGYHKALRTIENQF